MQLKSAMNTPLKFLFLKERDWLLTRSMDELGGIVPTDYDPVKNVVGAGPFKLESFTPGQRSRFVRFENYWKENQLMPMQ